MASAQGHILVRRRPKDGNDGDNAVVYDILCPISNFVRNSLGNWVVPVATAQFTKDGILNTNGEKLYCGVTFTQNPDGTITQQYTLLIWRGASHPDMQVGPDVRYENFAILFFEGSGTHYNFTAGEVYTLAALETKIGFKIAKTYPLGTLSDGKDGTNGADGTSSFPRACGEWKANKTYVWDKDFRDACYTIVNGISTVWIRDGYGTQAPNTEPVTGSHIGWILGNKEMFTAIDTALIDGADIAGFLYRNNAMQSRIGYYFQNNGTLIENKTQTQANEDPNREGAPKPANWSPNIYMDGKNGIIENSGSVSSNTTMFSRNFMATSSVSGMLSNKGTRDYNAATTSMQLNDRTGISISYSGKYNPFETDTKMEYDKINFAVDLNNPTNNYHGLLEIRVSGDLRTQYNQQGINNDTPYIPLVLSTEVHQLTEDYKPPIVQQQLALLIKSGLTAGIRKKIFHVMGSQLGITPDSLESGAVIILNDNHTLDFGNNVRHHGDYFLIFCEGANTKISGIYTTTFTPSIGLHMAIYDYDSINKTGRWRFA
ncbi:MAG: hypothetical protein RR386_05850 [Bacteroidaceae bacterium]